MRSLVTLSDTWRRGCVRCSACGGVRRPMVIGRTQRACQLVCVSAGNVILKINKWNEAKRHCTMAPFFST
jgi:hypothetical protein